MKSQVVPGEKDYYTHSPNTQQLASFWILPTKYVRGEILHIKFINILHDIIYNVNMVYVIKYTEISNIQVRAVIGIKWQSDVKCFVRLR